MEALAADFCLSFEAGKIKVRELLKPGVLTRNHQTFYRLGKQILMVKWNKCTLILKRKNNPDSH